MLIDIAQSLERRFAARASEIAPTRAQLDAAKRSQRYLRVALDSGQMANRIVDDYLIGSYARWTALRPLDDVDILFIVNPVAWQGTFQRVFHQLPAPETILTSFAAAIRYRYPESTVRVQNRSVGLKMEHLDIDAVPAVPHPNNEQWHRVPDRRSGTWVDTGPKAHAAVTTQINKRSGEVFVPLVRLLKVWNKNLPTTVSLKSFAIETLATRVFRVHPLSSLLGGLRAFFDFVCWRGDAAPTGSWSDACDVSFGWLNRKIPDVAGTGSNLLSGVDNAQMQAFVAASRVSRDALDSAARGRSVETAWAHVDRRFAG